MGLHQRPVPSPIMRTTGSRVYAPPSSDEPAQLWHYCKDEHGRTWVAAQELADLHILAGETLFPHELVEEDDGQH